MSIKIRNNASNSNRLCDFKLNSVSLPESESCKYLDVHIDKKLKFTTHIDEIKKIVCSKRNCIKVRALYFIAILNIKY